MSVAEAVKRARQARGWSQLELALAAGTTQDRVSAIEAGADCRVRTLGRLAAALGLEHRLGDYCLNTIESLRLAS